MSLRERIKMPLQIRNSAVTSRRTSPKPIELGPGGIHVFESRHAPGFEMEMGVWSYDKLCFVRQGRCSLLRPHTRTALVADDMLFVPAGTPHRFTDDPARPATLILVCFQSETFRKAPGQWAGYELFRSRMPCPLRTSQTHRHAAIRSYLQRMMFEQTMARDAHETVIWGLMIQLMVTLARTSASPRLPDPMAPAPRAFAQTLTHIDENFTEDIRIANLAAMAGVSYRHYTTLFRAAKGMTVGAYVTKLRIDFAKKRLLETDNIVFAGLDAGFGDLSHFYRVFRRAVGTTPRRYIEEHGAKAAVGGY